MFWNLGKYGVVNLPGPFTDMPGGKVCFAYLEKIITEARALGKIPWCVSEWHEMAAEKILGYKRESRVEFENRKSHNQSVQPTFL